MHNISNISPDVCGQIWATKAQGGQVITVGTVNREPEKSINGVIDVRKSTQQNKKLHGHIAC